MIIVAVPTHLVLCLRRVVTVAEMAALQQEARVRLGEALGAEGVSPSGPRMTVWRPGPDGRIDYAPSLPIAAPMPVEPPLSLFTLPAGRAAHAVLEAGYERLPGAWQALTETCRAQGLALAGLNWEIYTASPTGSMPPRTELFALLAPEEPAGSEEA